MSGFDIAGIILICGPITFPLTYWVLEQDLLDKMFVPYRWFLKKCGFTNCSETEAKAAFVLFLLAGVFLGLLVMWAGSEVNK